MKKIGIVAHFPPPINGMSKAVEVLYESELRDKYRLKKIDISNNKKIILNIFKIVFGKTDAFYITISQSIGGNMRDLLLIFLFLLKRKKYVLHLHGGYFGILMAEMNVIQKKINEFLIRKSSGVIVLGKSLIPIFADIVERDKIYIVPNCVESKYLSSSDEIEEKASMVNTAPNNVLYLSNFIEFKGYKDVLNLALLEKKNGYKKGLTFNFAGKFYSECDEKYFFDFISENQLENIVNYYGIVDGEEKNKLLKENKYFILLSRKEGQPISIIEAMGNGLIPITSDVGGIPDVISGYGDALVINLNDKQYLSKVYTFLGSIHNGTLIINNYKKVLNLYLEEYYLKRMDNIFSDI